MHCDNSKSSYIINNYVHRFCVCAPRVNFPRPAEFTVALNNVTLFVTEWWLEKLAKWRKPQRAHTPPLHSCANTGRPACTGGNSTNLTDIPPHTCISLPSSRWVRSQREMMNGYRMHATMRAEDTFVIRTNWNLLLLAYHIGNYPNLDDSLRRVRSQRKKSSSTALNARMHVVSRAEIEKNDKRLTLEWLPLVLKRRRSS